MSSEDASQALWDGSFLELEASKRKAFQEAAAKGLDPHSLMISYQRTETDDVEQETVFEDPADMLRHPRILVSVQAVLALRRICEQEFARAQLIAQAIDHCRSSYLKELTYLREQLATARGDVNSKLKADYVRNYDVHWFNPPDYVDSQLKRFLQDSIRMTHARLIEENYELKRKLGVNSLEELGIHDGAEDLVRSVLEQQGPAGIMELLHGMMSTEDATEALQTLTQLCGEEDPAEIRRREIGLREKVKQMESRNKSMQASIKELQRGASGKLATRMPGFVSVGVGTTDDSITMGSHTMSEIRQSEDSSATAAVGVDDTPWILQGSASASSATLDSPSPAHPPADDPPSSLHPNLREMALEAQCERLIDSLNALQQKMSASASRLAQTSSRFASKRAAERLGSKRAPSHGPSEPGMTRTASQKRGSGGSSTSGGHHTSLKVRGHGNRSRVGSGHSASSDAQAGAKSSIDRVGSHQDSEDFVIASVDHACKASELCVDDFERAVTDHIAQIGLSFSKLQQSQEEKRYLQMQLDKLQAKEQAHRAEHNEHLKMQQQLEKDLAEGAKERERLQKESEALEREHREGLESWERDMEEMEEKVRRLRSNAEDTLEREKRRMQTLHQEELERLLQEAAASSPMSRASTMKKDGAAQVDVTVETSRSRSVSPRDVEPRPVTPTPAATTPSEPRSPSASGAASLVKKAWKRVSMWQLQAKVKEAKEEVEKRMTATLTQANEQVLLAKGESHAVREHMEDLSHQLARYKSKCKDLRAQVKQLEFKLGLIEKAEEPDGSSSEEDVWDPWLAYWKRVQGSLKPRWRLLNEDSGMQKHRRNHTFKKNVYLASEASPDDEEVRCAFAFLRTHSKMEANREALLSQPMEAALVCRGLLSDSPSKQPTQTSDASPDAAEMSKTRHAAGGGKADIAPSLRSVNAIANSSAGDTDTLLPISNLPILCKSLERNAARLAAEAEERAAKRIQDQHARRTELLYLARAPALVDTEAAAGTGAAADPVVSNRAAPAANRTELEESLAIANGLGALRQGHGAAMPPPTVDKLERTASSPTVCGAVAEQTDAAASAVDHEYPAVVPANIVDTQVLTRKRPTTAPALKAASRSNPSIRALGEVGGDMVSISASQACSAMLLAPAPVVSQGEAIGVTPVLRASRPQTAGAASAVSAASSSGKAQGQSSRPQSSSSLGGRPGALWQVSPTAGIPLTNATKSRPSTASSTKQRGRNVVNSGAAIEVVARETPPPIGGKVHSVNGRIGSGSSESCLPSVSPALPPGRTRKAPPAPPWLVAS